MSDMEENLGSDMDKMHSELRKVLNELESLQKTNQVIASGFQLLLSYMASTGLWFRNETPGTAALTSAAMYSLVREKLRERGLLCLLEKQEALLEKGIKREAREKSLKTALSMISIVYNKSFGETGLN